MSRTEETLLIFVIVLLVIATLIAVPVRIYEAYDYNKGVPIREWERVRK